MAASWKQFFSPGRNPPAASPSSPYYHPVQKREEQQQQTEYRDSSSSSADDDDEAEEGLLTHRTKPRSGISSWLLRPLVLHLLIFSIYTAVYLILLLHPSLLPLSHSHSHPLPLSQDHYEHAVYSPAYAAVVKEAVEYQGQLRIQSPYQGPPSPALDQAWKELLQYSNVRVSGADLARVNKTSIPVPGEEDSYWVELSVVHELHCIKRLRQYWHSDYYFPNLTAEERRLNWLHNDHCLEILRQSVMCHADVSMITMTWEPTSVFPAADFQNAHECTNWDVLYDWQRERSVDMMKPGFLVHPDLGVPFPEGKYDGVGAADPDHAIGTAGERPDELMEMGIHASSSSSSSSSSSPIHDAHTHAHDDGKHDGHDIHGGLRGIRDIHDVQDHRDVERMHHA